MASLKIIRDVFKVFQNKESFFTEIDKKASSKLILNQVLIICMFGFVYGLVMGSYQGVIQSFVSGLKLMILFLASLLICFPSFYIIQLVLGSKMSFQQMIIIILSGFVLASTITLSFAPIIIFFLLTGSNYHFLQLLHVAVFVFAGVFGMKLMIDALKYACEKKSIYPQIGVTVLKVWIVILAFVGIQLSWNLRPFLGDKNDEFKLFRQYEGNFYTAVVYSVQQLFSDKNTKELENIDLNEIQAIESTDTTSLMRKLEE